MNLKYNKILLYGLLFAVFFLAFFWRFLNYYIFLGLLLIPWIVSNNKKVRLQARWIFYFIAIILSVIVSVNAIESFKWFYMIVLITLIASAGKNINQYRKILLKYFFYGSIFHCFFILLQYVNYPVALIFIKALVPPDVAETSSIGAFINFGVCTGVAGEAAFAMLYSSYVFFYGFIKYISCKNNWYIPFILLGLICILLNGKRIAIVINVFTAFISYFMLIRSSNKQGNSIVTILVVIALVIGIVAYTDLGTILMEKNTQLAESGDLSNGRADLNNQMLSIFKDHPMFGIGPFCTSFYAGEYLGHNIYLTTLSENGILGFLCLVVLLFLNLKDTYCRFKDGDTSIYMYISIYIQIFFIIYGLTGNPLYGPQFLITYILFAINENRNLDVS